MHDVTPDPIQTTTHWIFADGTRLPIISGGDGSTEPKPPTIDQITASLENLESLDSEALAALAADIRTAYEAERNPEDGAVNLDTLSALRAGLEKVTEAQTQAAAVEAKLAAELAEMDAVMAGEAVTLSAEDAAALEGISDADLAVLAQHTPEEWEAAAFLLTDPDAPAEPPAVEEPVAQAASAAPRVVRLPASPVQPAPVEDVRQASVGTLARTGQPATEAEVFKELQKTAMELSGAGGRRRVGQEIPVATIDLKADVPRMGADEDAEAFYARQLGGLRQARGQDPGETVRQASGTLCAPILTDYAVPVIGSQAQPIGGVFPSGAGGTADQMKTLNFVQAMTFDDFTDVTTSGTWGTAGGGATSDTVGIGSATATQNALALDNASSPYPKLAMVANCPTFVTCEQRAVWLEIQYDNLGSMAFPEFVAAVRQGGDIALANFMDALRLEDWYQAAETGGSTLGSVAQAVNANHNYLATILNIVQTDRSNKRDWETPYIVAQPAFTDSLLAAEQLGTAAIAAGQRAITEARDQIARDYNISFVNYLGRFGTTSAAYLTEYGYDTILPALPTDSTAPLMPCQVRVGIARDDAGFNRIGDTLNLGMLRTESNLEDNNWTTFWETWQRLCFRIPPIVADINVNPNMLVEGYVSNFSGAAVRDLCAGSGS